MSSNQPGNERIFFKYAELGARLEAFPSEMGWSVARAGRVLVSGPGYAPVMRLVLPALAPDLSETQSLEQYVAHLPTPGTFLILLIQAGATSMGIWSDERLLCHKVIKKYVTRGNGKAQTSYLKTKGKSRYGSRLRLQNAKAHLVETNEKLHEWFDIYGRPQRIFYSCPVRLWPELFEASSQPPFRKADMFLKIGMDVRVPCFEELLRVKHFLEWGSVYFGEEPST